MALQIDVRSAPFEPGHVLDRYLDRQFQSLFLRSVDEGHRTVSRGRGARRGELVVNRLVRRGNGGCAAADVSFLSGPGRAETLPPRMRQAAEKTRDLVERPLRGGEPDPLQRRCALSKRLQPFNRECEVRTSLGRHQRMNFVDD
jgi:hypothetical protein